MPTIQELLNDMAAKSKAERAPADAKAARNAFYNSRSWRAARYQALKAANGRCQCCGRGSADGARLVVDHIKPVRHHWDLRLEPTNFQVLCSDCNLAKASSDQTDWRK